MPYTMEDFRREVACEHLAELTAEERLVGLPAEEVLVHYTEDQIEAYLKRLAKKPATTRKKNPKRRNRTT